MSTALPTYKPMTIQERLDAIKEKHGLSSDYKLALYLGMGETAVANYRRGRSLPDSDAIDKIAKALDENPALLAAEVEAFRAKSMTAKLLWASAVGLLHTVLSINAQKGGKGSADEAAHAATKRLLDKISKGGGGAAALAACIALSGLAPQKADAGGLAAFDITSIDIYIVLSLTRTKQRGIYFKNSR